MVIVTIMSISSFMERALRKTTSNIGVSAARRCTTEGHRIFRSVNRRRYPAIFRSSLCCFRHDRHVLWGIHAGNDQVPLGKIFGPGQPIYLLILRLDDCSFCYLYLGQRQLLNLIDVADN